MEQSASFSDGAVSTFSVRRSSQYLQVGAVSFGWSSHYLQLGAVGHGWSSRCYQVAALSGGGYSCTQFPAATDRGLKSSNLEQPKDVSRKRKLRTAKEKEEDDPGRERETGDGQAPGQRRVAIMAECVTLHTGQKMPLIGLGTWKSSPGQVKEAVTYALGAGYRHIDCAAVYDNEGEIGEAFQEVLGSDKPIKREDVFVTSKLWNTKHQPEDVEPALRKSLQDLKLDYLDLYLMHWPYGFQRGGADFPRDADGKLLYDSIDYKETWKAMEKLVKKGLVRAIGFSNFNSRQVDDIIGIATVKPAVLQVECHPYLAQHELLAHCQARGIVLTAYSPLGSPDRLWKHPDEPVLLEEPGVKALAEKYGKSPAQILLRWQVQRKVVCIPKSVTPSRISQNLQVFDFSLTEDEMKQIGSLDKKWRYIIPMITVDGKSVPRDAGHPFYPFSEPF